MEFDFRRKKFELQKTLYSDGHIALGAFNTEKKSIDYVLTIVVPNFTFPNDKIAIKTWGGNKKILHSVYNLGIFNDTCVRGYAGSFRTKVIEFWEFIEDFDISRIPKIKTQ